ncbi:hypothetical protein N9J34_00620 [Candidatus Pelagibacter ubique]|nr:hypothetical protein [Candidatus Pelagibacter ubique]
MFNKLQVLLNDINKISKKEKKNRAFIISNTSDKKTKKYLTPLRKSLNCVYGGAVVYDDLTTKKICQLIKNKIDYLFIDTEKKASLKNGVINIERTVRENISPEKIFYFKANDLTVDAASSLLELLFHDDIRNVANKKILIIGAGNIGFKLALKLIERGVKVFLNGKRKMETDSFISTINKIKPAATMNKVKHLHKIKDNLNKFDVIINVSNGNSKILKNKEIFLKKGVIFLEIGRNLFSNETLNYFLNIGIIILRLDVSSSFNELIEKKINTKNELKKIKFSRSKKNGFNLISRGLLGLKGDIIVDDSTNPKIIYGRINKVRNLDNISWKDKKKIINQK